MLDAALRIRLISWLRRCRRVPFSGTPNRHCRRASCYTWSALTRQLGTLGSPRWNQAWLLVAGVTVLLLAIASLAQPPEPLVLVQTIALPDVRGRIDHLDIDLEGGRLFVAALGNDTVEVIDLNTGRRITRIEHLREPQGVVYDPDAKRLIVASGADARVDVLDGSTLSPIARVATLQDADNLRYEPARGRLYVGYGSALAVVDALNMEKVADVRLAGHPESFQLESTGSRIFVNIPSARQVAIVDRLKGTVLATWNLGEMGANFPIMLDEVNHRLLVVTRRPAALLAYDTETGKRVGGVPVCGDADDLFFDSGRKRAYVICGEGAVAVVQQVNPDHYEVIGQVDTAPGARTGLLVPARRTLYVAVPAQLSAPAEIRVYKVN